MQSSKPCTLPALYISGSFFFNKDSAILSVCVRCTPVSSVILAMKWLHEASGFATYLTQSLLQTFFLTLFLCNICSWSISTSFPAQWSLKDLCAEENVCQPCSAGWMEHTFDLISWSEWLKWILKSLLTFPNSVLTMDTKALNCGLGCTNITGCIWKCTPRTFLTLVCKHIRTRTRAEKGRWESPFHIPKYKYVAGGGGRWHFFHLTHSVCPHVHLHVHAHTVNQVFSFKYTPAEIGNVSL